MTIFSYYCFTAWNEPVQFQAKNDVLVYLIYGIEKCPTTGQVHFQGYVEFRKRMSMEKVKLFFNDNTIHIERRRGTQEEAIEYCKKDDNYHEVGTPNYSGKRNDLLSSINSCTTVHQFALKDPVNYIRYHNGIKDYYNIKQLHEKKGTSKCQVHIYWGLAGSGKSFSVLDAIGDDPYYFWTPSTNNSGPWFDGYLGQKHIVLDDFYGNLPYTLLLQMTDPYLKKVQLPIKNGHSLAFYEHLWITSNTDPMTWYKNVRDRTGWFRRVKAADVRQFTQDDLQSLKFVHDLDIPVDDVDDDVPILNASNINLVDGFHFVDVPSKFSIGIDVDDDDDICILNNNNNNCHN